MVYLVLLAHQVVDMWKFIHASFTALSLYGLHLYYVEDHASSLYGLSSIMLSLMSIHR